MELGGTPCGTTSNDGTGSRPFGHGTVFKVKASGAESVLHPSSGQTAAQTSAQTAAQTSAQTAAQTRVAGVIYVGGRLYGTTFGGGPSGNGTVFKIATSLAETVLHGFGGGVNGAGRVAGLAVPDQGAFPPGPETAATNDAAW